MVWHFSPTLTSSHDTQVHEGARLDHVSVGWNFAGAGALPQGSFPMEKPRDEQMKRRGVVFRPVVHLVREPLSSIHALAGCLCPGNAIANKRLAYLDNASYEYASRCLDNNTWLHVVLRQRLPPSRLSLATAYWVSWNKLAASNAQACRWWAYGEVSGGPCILCTGWHHVAEALILSSQFSSQFLL